MSKPNRPPFTASRLHPESFFVFSTVFFLKEFVTLLTLVKNENDLCVCAHLTLKLLCSPQLTITCHLNRLFVLLLKSPYCKTHLNLVLSRDCHARQVTDSISFSICSTHRQFTSIRCRSSSCAWLTLVHRALSSAHGRRRHRLRDVASRVISCQQCVASRSLLFQCTVREGSASSSLLSHYLRCDAMRCDTLRCRATTSQQLWCVVFSHSSATAAAQVALPTPHLTSFASCHSIIAARLTAPIMISIKCVPPPFIHICFSTNASNPEQACYIACDAHDVSNLCMTVTSWLT